MDRAVSVLRGAGHTVTAIPTDGPGAGARTAASCLALGADLILVAGGDGAINEVANGMIGSEVPLGVLSAGTANVLATELRLAGPLAAVAAQVEHWVPRRIAVGRLDAASHPPRYFLLMAGVGLDAHAVLQVDPQLKRFQGKLAYWLAAFGELGRTLEEFDVLVENQRFRSSFALASRVRNYGATLELTPQAGLMRDDFAVALFEGSNPFRYLEYFAGAVLNRLDRTRGVTLLHARSVAFESLTDAPVYVQVDGEPAATLPARIELVPAALTLLCPPEFG